MYIIMFLTLILGTVLYLHDKRHFNIDFLVIAKFLAIMTLAFFFRLCMTSLYVDLGYDLTEGARHIYKAAHWSLGLVFWEDIVFVTPIILINKHLKNKFISFVIIASISIYFGYNHLYQGLLAGLIITLYPYFISYKFSKKIGLGNVMVCHVLYDLITVYGHIITMEYIYPFLQH